MCGIKCTNRNALNEPKLSNEDLIGFTTEKKTFPLLYIQIQNDSELRFNRSDGGGITDRICFNQTAVNLFCLAMSICLSIKKQEMPSFNGLALEVVLSKSWQLCSRKGK